MRHSNTNVRFFAELRSLLHVNENDLYNYYGKKKFSSPPLQDMEQEVVDTNGKVSCIHCQNLGLLTNF